VVVRFWVGIWEGVGVGDVLPRQSGVEAKSAEDANLGMLFLVGMWN
jgi:hypothetical protein